MNKKPGFYLYTDFSDDYSSDSYDDSSDDCYADVCCHIVHRKPTDSEHLNLTELAKETDNNDLSDLIQHLRFPSRKMRLLKNSLKLALFIAFNSKHRFFAEKLAEELKEQGVRNFPENSLYRLSWHLANNQKEIQNSGPEDSLPNFRIISSDSSDTLYSPSSLSSESRISSSTSSLLQSIPSIPELAMTPPSPPNGKQEEEEDDNDSAFSDDGEAPFII